MILTVFALTGDALHFQLSHSVTGFANASEAIVESEERPLRLQSGAVRQQRAVNPPNSGHRARNAANRAAKSSPGPTTNIVEPLPVT